MKFNLLQTINEKALAEKFEEYSNQELVEEIEAQFKNLESLKPKNINELHKFGPGIVGAARDLIAAVQQYEQKTAQEQDDYKSVYKARRRDF